MRQKIFSLLLCVLLLLPFFLGAPAAKADAAISIVRVKLSVGTTKSLSFFIDGNYSIAGNDGVALERQLYTVKVESGKINLYYGASRLCGGSSLRFQQHAPTAGRNNFIWLKWSAGGSSAYAGYLGDMEFLVSAGNLLVVNHVYIEDYLYGVVPFEMSNSWPIEALKAQAVAARNYAYARMNGSGSYDVVDTATDQVYRGFNAANANAIQAVDQTANQALVCQGQLVEMFYSASNGGYTEIPQHVWNASAPLKPYHIIQPDPYDVQNPSSLQEMLTFPKVITGTARIVSSAADNGNESANAEKYLKDLALPAIAAMGTYAAASAADFQITGVNSIVPNTYIAQHDIKDYAGGGLCVSYQKADVNMNVLARRLSDGGEETVALTVTMDMTQLAAAGGPYQAFDYSMSTLRLFTVEDAGAQWRIYHRRYGHGIGLSQRGVQQRANSSDPSVNTYDKILEFYYPNTTFSALPYARPALTPAPAPDHSNATAACPGTTLSVRSSPDSSVTANILGALPDGARIGVTRQNAASGWHQIVYDNQYAYVSAACVKMDQGNPPPAPGPVKLGDVNGDGVISISDYTLVRLDILGIKALTGNAKTAANVNGDNTISISDYTLIRLDILGIKKIN